MNVKQQLNNSFFALFIGAMLIGARDTNNFQHIHAGHVIFFIFFFFLRLKVYLDDNINFKTGEKSSDRKDFVFGYLTTLMSWIIFPVAAYRIWDQSLNSSIIFLSISLVFLTLWTTSAAFIIPPKEAIHKQWFWTNIIYIITLGLLYINNNYLAEWFCHPNDNFINFLSIFFSSLLNIILLMDYKKGKTFDTIKQ